MQKVVGGGTANRYRSMASIRKRPDGRWRARYRDEAGREHARHFTRRVDGQRWLDEVTTAVISGQYVDPRAGRITFESFYQEWSARQLWQTTTQLAMGLAARSVPFADLPLGKVRRSHIEQWVKGMQSAGLAPGTIRTRYKNVARVFRAAVDDRAIPVDPCKGVSLPAVRRAEAAMQLPAADQVGALLQSADESFAAFLGLCAFAGLRLGEAAAVQVGDIDFLRRTLKVSRQVQRGGGSGVEVRAPKYGSERTVFLPDGLLAMLSQQVARRNVSDAQNVADMWLFVDSTGTLPTHQNSVSDRWRTNCKRAGVTGFTLHDLRHFYASGLIAAGCDVVTVQRALGHAQASTTLNVYAHLWPSAEDRTRAAAADLMSSAIPADSLRTTGEV
jgi:integrase